MEGVWYCQECQVTVKPDCSMEKHRHSRKHINRLLQLGLELPDDLPVDPKENQFPEESRNGYCITCEISIGLPVQAAAHYRSREHLNRRLQRGLPVAELPPSAEVSQSSASRDHINECLRRGVGIQPPPRAAPPVRSMNNSLPHTAEAPTPRGFYGKRKFPTGFPGAYSPSSGAAPTNSPPQFANFSHEKRPCRPRVPIMKQQPSYAVKSYAVSPRVTLSGQGTSFSEQCVPHASSYSAGHGPANSYQMEAPRMPPASTFASQFQDPQVPSKVNYSWNSSNGDYEDFGVSYSQPARVVETWPCEVCSMELPNASAWQLHMTSHSMKLAMPNAYMLQ